MSTYEVQMRGGNYGDNVRNRLFVGSIDQSFFLKKNKNKNCLFDDVNKPLRFTVSERVEKNIE